MQQKILFLDFDGPLHPTSAIQGLHSAPDERIFSARNLFCWAHHLETIFTSLPETQRQNTLIAAHSSWRRLAGLSQPLIRQYLGPNLGRQYIGMTRPDLPRWESIQDMCNRGGFENFLIVDDAVEEFPADLPQLVVCDPLLGLSDHKVQNAIREWMASGEIPGEREKKQRRLVSAS